MIELEHSTSTTEFAPLSWRLVGSDDQVMVKCAKGHLASLDHEIAADGTVTPSLGCPTEGCDWHEMVRLKDWAD
jgi:hypothetical protein